MSPLQTDLLAGRAVSEKLAIVRLTMEPGANIGEIARAHE